MTQGVPMAGNEEHEVSPIIDFTHVRTGDVDKVTLSSGDEIQVRIVEPAAFPDLRVGDVPKITIDAAEGAALEVGRRTFPIELVGATDVLDTVAMATVTSADEDSVTLEVIEILAERWHGE